MNWVSKKLILNQIRKYFELDDEDQFKVSITGQQKIKCHDLKLKIGVVNKSTSSFHVNELHIKYLQIAYDTTKDEPLMVSVDGIKLVLAFNPRVERQPPQYTKTQDILKTFNEAIHNKQVLQRGSFWSQFSQMQKLILETFIGRLSLVIKRVDVAIEYHSGQESRFIGLQLGEISIRQRMVISHVQKQHLELHQDQILCAFRQVSLYLGIQAEQDKILSKARSKEIVYKVTTIKKNYLMFKNQISLSYNFSKGNLAIQITQLALQISNLTIYELSKISQQFSKYLSERPILRPHQGKSVLLESAMETLHMTEGTIKWWHYLFDKVVLKVSERRDNFLTSSKYRIYMFFILYKYTFGSNKYIQERMRAYEQNRVASSIMRIYYTVLAKIKTIRQSKKHERDQYLFVFFLQVSQSIKKIQRQNGLRYIKYDDIKKSKPFFNIENCRIFSENLSKNWKKISINVTSFKLNIIMYKHQLQIIDWGFKLSPHLFYSLKAKYIGKYYKRMFEDQNRSFSTILKLQMSKLSMNRSRIQLKVNFQQILASREDNQLILKIHHLAFIKENKSLLNDRNSIIIAEKNKLIQIKSIYLNIHDDLVRHLLIIKLLMSEDLTKPLSQKQDFEQYLYANVYKKLSMHPLFEVNNDQSFALQIQKMIIVTSLFTNNQYLTLQLGETTCSAPRQGKAKLVISKANVNRSSLSNIDKIRHGSIQRLVIEKQSTLIQSNKPLVINIEQYPRAHFVNSKQKLKTKIGFIDVPRQRIIDRNHKDISYIYHEPIIDIVVPFILIQISFLDIYYFQLMLNYWKEIIGNPYFFPKRSSKTELQKQLVKFKELSIQYIEKQDSFTRVGRRRCKFQGIEIVVYGENKRQADNRMLAILLQGISFEEKIYILGQKTKISVMNMFVENCLGNKVFNSRRLNDMLSNPDKEDEPLIFPPKQSERENSVTQLILYGYPEEKEQQNLLQITITNNLDLKNLKKTSSLDAEVKPLFLYQQPQFYQILKSSFRIILQTAKANYKPRQIFSFVQVLEQFPAEGSSHQILQAKNITEQFTLSMKIARLNILVLHSAIPIFTISFLGVKVTHKTQLYVTKYHIVADEFYVVDISPHCGLHPIVIKSRRMDCYFTSYQSDLLRQKEKKSCYLKIIMENAELHYLNRKIKQFTNFIMSHFKNTEADDQPAESEPSNKKNEPQEILSYPFCYKIEMIDPIIMLLRNSLSEQKFAGEAAHIVLHNMQDRNQDEPSVEHADGFFFHHEKQEELQQSFQTCRSINEQKIKFYPFKREGDEDEEETSNIFVSIKQLNFYPIGNIHNSVIYIPTISVILKGKELTANVVSTEFSLNQTDYNLLIRITEQNFSEVPVSFPNESALSDVKAVSFQSSYKVEQMVMLLKKNKQLQIFGELRIKNIRGVNILYSNGQKQDKITLQSLNYQSYFKNQLKNIIKNKPDEGIKQQDFLNKVFSTMSQNQCVFSCKHFANHQSYFEHEDEDEQDFNVFFKAIDGLGFKFGQKRKEKLNERKNGLTATQDEDKQQKKIERVGKWFGGMCQKCLCCFKKKQQKKQPEELQLQHRKPTTSRRQVFQPEQQNVLNRQNYPFLEQSLITSESEMIKFKKKIDPLHYHKRENILHPIFMHILGERNKQKRMYMLVQNLIIYYESKQHVMELINFMNKPYAEPEKPQYVRDSRFNNHRPFQMLVELTNTSIEANHSDISGNRSIVLDVDMIYNFQKLGDQVNGPGKKVMSVDLLCEMKFVNSKHKVIPISNQLRIFWQKETKTVFDAKQPKQNKEKLYMFGVEKQKKEKFMQFKAKSQREKQELITNPIIFKLPISNLKELNVLIKNIFAKKQPQKQLKNLASKDRQRNMKKMSLSLPQQYQFELKKKPMSTNPAEAKATCHSQLKKSAEPKQLVQNNIAQRTKNIKIYFVPKMVIEIQVGQTTSYLTTNIQNGKYHVLEGNRPLMNAQSQTTSLECYIDYFNLNLVKLEPFLEKTNVEFALQSYKIDDNENNSFKVSSKAEKDKNTRDYRKGLSLNISSAFYHTLKELHLKFQLGSQSMQIWDEICFNLTVVDTWPHEIVFQNNEMCMDLKRIKEDSSLFQPQPPELKNFFGKKFQADNRKEVNKKKSKKKNEMKTKQFHMEGIPVFLYHSFIQNATKLKKIIYRTPFRIINQVSQKVELKLKFRPKGLRSWEYTLQYKDYYCLPGLIYETDFLMNILATKKQRRDLLQNRETWQIIQPSILNQKRQQQLMGTLSNMNIRVSSINDQVKAYQSFTSVKYLFQINAKICDYHKVQKNKFYQYLFTTSDLQERYVDKRDILIRSNNITLSIVNVKSYCEEVKDGQSKNKIIFYDSLTVIMSPIIIYNYTNFNLGVTVCRSKKIQIPKGRKIQINEFTEEIQFKDVTLQFAQDIVHHQYRFFDPQFKTDRQKTTTIKKILIDRMQSLNVKIIKQTYNTCILEIFPDWVIINKTQMEFQLQYNKKQFPVDKNSASSLAIDEQQRFSKGEMKIKLYDNQNPSEEFYTLITEAQTQAIFTLVKVANRNSDRQVYFKKLDVLKQDEGCCNKSKIKSKSSYLKKYQDEKPYKCIQFALSTFEGIQHELTRELVINYKYEVINCMDYRVVFYQSDGEAVPYSQSQQSSIELFKLGKNESHYLYSYDFLPKIYYIKMKFLNRQNKQQEYISNQFTCDAETGQSFSLKLKSTKNNSGSSKFVRVDLNQSNYTNELSFKYIDEKQQQVKHPFYIKNATAYQVKVTQNDNTFSLNGNFKSPFLWSNLVNNNHKIKIQILGNSQEFSMKQNSQFAPIVIRDDKFNSQVRKVQRNMVKKQTCKVRCGQNFSQYEVIYDMFYKKLHIKEKDQSSKVETFEISKIESIKKISNKIELIPKSNKRNFNLQIFPSQSSLNDWFQVLSRDIENDIIDKIYFTIESLEHSMIFFIHNVDISSDNNLKQILKEYIIESLFVSVIYNHSHKVQQLLLINMEDIQYTTQQRISSINYKNTENNRQSMSGHATGQHYKIKKFQQCFKIKKLKINNQLLDATNPVILSQIKKSKFPFIQYKTQKQTLIEELDNPSNKSGIQHYKTIIFFLDEAEFIIESSLFPKLLNFKKFIEDINKNYIMDEKNYENLGSVEVRKKKNQIKQIYIDHMKIMPIKMTISVNFDSLQSITSSKWMNFLTLIPTGVENAIITIDSYIFHHVFSEDQLIKNKLKSHYLYEMKKQIVYNAGSIEILAPLQIIQGLGVGVTSIFYNPLYSLVNNSEIQAITFTSNIVQGIISFIVKVLTSGITFMNAVVKMISHLTFDSLFKSRRQMLKKQIFKSPIDGFNYGGRYFIKILKQVCVNFSEQPVQYHKKIPYIGFIMGFLWAFVLIFPWCVKVIVTLFDFLYVIIEGFFNWGHYQQNSMKYRSRPIRTFPHKQILPYDFLTAKGNQIMRKHQIDQSDNQMVTFISFIDEADQSRYLVLSNYRILYCTNQLLSFREIKLYQIQRVVVKGIDRNVEESKKIEVKIYLRIPEKKRRLCFQQVITEYKIKFTQIKKLKEFTGNLKNLMEKQRENLSFEIDQNELEVYEKFKHSQIAT